MVIDVYALICRRVAVVMGNMDLGSVWRSGRVEIIRQRMEF